MILSNNKSYRVNLSPVVVVCISTVNLNSKETNFFYFYFDILTKDKPCKDFNFGIITGYLFHPLLIYSSSLKSEKIHVRDKNTL